MSTHDRHNIPGKPFSVRRLPPLEEVCNAIGARSMHHVVQAPPPSLVFQPEATFTNTPLGATAGTPRRRHRVNRLHQQTGTVETPPPDQSRLISENGMRFCEVLRDDGIRC